MKDKILVTGSIAYDYLYAFDGVFQNSIDTSATHLSVAFDINDKKIMHGGCGANIVYGGVKLNDNFVLVGVAGKDYREYEERLDKFAISSKFVVKRDDKYTSQAAIVTDSKNQQITFFYMGAAQDSEKDCETFGTYMDELATSASIGIVAPNGKGFMRTAMEKFKEHSIPYLFDPGQATPIFSGDELIEYSKSALGTIMNEYEAGLVMKQAQIDKKTLENLSTFVVITLGERGAELFFKGKKYEINDPKTAKVVDPTGCGDAFRAGMLATLNGKTDNLTADLLIEACQKGTELAARCLEVVGTQSY